MPTKPHNETGDRAGRPRKKPHNEPHANPGRGSAAMSDSGGFLANQESSVSSSNVASARYDPEEQYLVLGFQNGGRYGYHDVSSHEATDFWSSGSKGGWVWDHLRRRGTKFGYQKSYAYIHGQSPAYEPQYYKSEDDRELHRRIDPSGKDLEWTTATDRKVPKAWKAERGPFDINPPKKPAKEEASKPAAVPVAKHAPAAVPTAQHAPAEVPVAQHASPEQTQELKYEPPKKPTSMMSTLMGRVGQMFGLGGRGGKHMAEGGVVPGVAGLGGMQDETNIKAQKGEVVVKEEAARDPEVMKYLLSLNAGTAGDKSPPEHAARGIVAGSTPAQAMVETPRARGTVRDNPHGLDLSWLMDEHGGGGVAPPSYQISSPGIASPPPTPTLHEESTGGSYSTSPMANRGEMAGSRMTSAMPVAVIVTNFRDLRDIELRFTAAGTPSPSAAAAASTAAAGSPAGPHMAPLPAPPIFDRVHDALQHLSDEADRLPAELSVISERFSDVEEAARRFQAAMNDTSGTAVQQRMRKQMAFESLDESLSVAEKPQDPSMFERLQRGMHGALGGGPQAAFVGGYVGQQLGGAAGGAIGASLAGGSPVGAAMAVGEAVKEAGYKAIGAMEGFGGKVRETGESFSKLLGVPDSVAGAASAIVAFPFKAIMGGVKDAWAAAVGIVEIIKNPMNMMRDGFSSLGEIATSTGRALYEMRDPAAMVAGALQPFVSQVNKFSPGTVERFNLALDNLAASAGVIFEPLVEGGRAFADELNQMYTAVGPQIRATMEQIVPLMTSFGREVGGGLVHALQQVTTAAVPVIQVFSSMGPAIGMAVGAAGEILASTIGALEPPFRWLRDAAIRLAATFMWLSQRGSLLAPGGIGNALTGNSSIQSVGQIIASLNSQYQPQQQGGAMTYAARPARHVGIEDVGMEARRSAFSMGTSTIPQQQLTALQQIQVLLQQMVGQGNAPGPLQILPGLMGPLFGGS